MAKRNVTIAGNGKELKITIPKPEGEKLARPSTPSTSRQEIDLTHSGNDFNSVTFMQAHKGESVKTR